MMLSPRSLARLISCGLLVAAPVFCQTQPGATTTTYSIPMTLDANNRWIHRCNQAGSTIKIIEALWSLVSPRDAWAGEIKPSRKKTDRAKKDLPPTAERNKLRTDLKRLGYSQAEADAIVENGVAREKITSNAIVRQKAAPKAS